MHTIITDYGRSYKEITDAEWDIGIRDARFEKAWTFGAAWHDHLTSEARMQNEHLATLNRIWKPVTEAAGLLGAARNECRLMKQACQSARM
jgi:hypothetical protein